MHTLQAGREGRRVNWATLSSFPPGFFDRQDPTPDAAFYRPSRLVTHIDDHAIEAVGSLYRRLDLTGEVLDLMASWISHFEPAPQQLTGLGMNAAELATNPALKSYVVHDLNRTPHLPFEAGRFDDAVCCVSVDYLVRPLEVFRDVARVLRPGGRFVHTFSNRCFPTKAIRGWLLTSDADHMGIVQAYFRLSGGFEPAAAEVLVPPGQGRDPLFGVWARRKDHLDG